MSNFSVGGFGFNGVGVDTVAQATNRAILPVLVLDATKSISWAKEGDESAAEDVRGILTKSIVEMKAKGVHEGAYVGAWYFNTEYQDALDEVIPFTGIDDVDVDAVPALIPDGATPMFEATYNALNATSEYGKQLDDAGVTVDAFVCLVTDGKPEGHQKYSAEDVKRVLEEIRNEQAEVRLASLYFAVIGIGEEVNKDFQQSFADEIGADAYFFAGDMSDGTIGKIVGWFSSSVHLSQQVGASQAVDADFDTD